MKRVNEAGEIIKVLIISIKMIQLYMLKIARIKDIFKP